MMGMGRGLGPVGWSWIKSVHNRIVRGSRLDVFRGNTMGEGRRITLLHESPTNT